MSKAERPVLLVGGVPGETAEEVFQTVGPILGDLAIGLTDGEIGLRRMWIFFVALNTWATHPEMEMIRPVKEGVPDMPDWVPAGYHDFQWFGAKIDIEKLSVIKTLGYPEEAKASYDIFVRMRNEGVIPQGVRFQQSLPFPDDAVRLFTNNAHNMSLMVDAYVDVMKRDVANLCEIIPHEDLVLQWDVNWETVAIEHGDHMPDTPPMQFKPDGDPMDRFEYYIRELNSVIPANVSVGLHLCYGDLHHKHFKDPNDLATSVIMANKAVDVSRHPINFVQMSIPINRDDDAYFEPLRDLNIGDTSIYAGLIHYSDGVEGSVKRLETFKRYFDGPTGVATECGLGRRPNDQDLITLLNIHHDVAAAI